MILVLDNYDSFTYNVVQYLGELNADLQVFRNDAITIDKVERLRPEGIVLSPGPGRPEQAGIMNRLIGAFAGRVPILGICLGHQAIAQVLGGKISYAPILMHGKTSEIEHNHSVLYRDIPSPFTATRYHSLIVERETIREGLEISAWTSDNVIMGIQHRTLPLYGVQYHPESIMTTHGKAILKNFLETIA